MALGVGTAVAGAAKVVLSVDDKDFNRGLSSADRKFKQSTDELDRHSKRMATAANVVHTAWKAAWLAIGAGVVAAGFALRSFYQELTQSQKSAAQTAAVIKSTGGVANVTAKQVDELSNSLLRKTGIDDEVIQNGENMLLTFRNVGTRSARTTTSSTRRP